MLSSRYPVAPSAPIAGLREWVPHSDDAFILRDREIPYWHHAVRSVGSMHSLDEYRNFVEALRADPIAGPHVEVIVTSERGGGRTITAAGIADRVVWMTAEKCNGFFFDEAQFDQMFAEFETDLRRNEIDYFIIGPLSGFKTESLPIALDDNWEIDTLSDDEIVRCLRLGISPGIDMGDLHHLNGRSGVRLKISAKKLFGNVAVDLRQAQISHDAITSKLRDIVHALRVFKRGRVSIPGIVTFSAQWPLNESMTGGHLDPMTTRNNKYELSHEEANRFQSFWRVFKRSKDVPFLDAAVRRFGYAGERHRPEDRLIDLLICAESLFLTDAGSAQERTELRFRLAQRFAFFTEIDGYKRIDRFRLMRNAYDARSAIVHGGEVAESTLSLPGEGKVSLLKFVDTIEDVLRVALHRSIETPYSNTAPANWEALIFGTS